MYPSGRQKFPLSTEADVADGKLSLKVSPNDRIRGEDACKLAPWTLVPVSPVCIRARTQLTLKRQIWCHCGQTAK